jgi:hypothetical protein
MVCATFGKSDRQHAQYYYQTPYRRRIQAHRRGWLNVIQIQAVCMGLSGPFLFPETKIKEAAGDSVIRSKP